MKLLWQAAEANGAAARKAAEAGAVEHEWLHLSHLTALLQALQLKERCRLMHLNKHLS